MARFDPETAHPHIHTRREALSIKTMSKKPASTTAAPASLSAESKALWKATLTEFAFDTSADYALLRQLCETLDRVRECQKQIAKDGLLIDGAAGQSRPHPLLAVEDQCRRSILASARALRLNSTPEV